MRRIIAVLAVVGLAVSASAGTGWMNSYVYMWDSVSQANTWYDLNGADQAENFHGADLGTFDISDDLYLNSEINAYADGGDFFNYMSIYYRIGTSGGFTEQQDATLDNISGNDWRALTPGAELISQVGGPGTYTLQVYLERSHSWGGGGPYITQLDLDGDTGGGGADNYWSATFDVIPEPGTLAMLGAGIVGLLVYRRRR